MAAQVLCRQCRQYVPARTEGRRNRTCTRCNARLLGDGQTTFRPDAVDGAGNRIRKPVYPSLALAELRDQEIRSARAKRQNLVQEEAKPCTLDDLQKWYAALPDVQQKRTGNRILQVIQEVVSTLGPNRRIEQVSFQDVADFQSMQRDSGLKPATINRKVAHFKAMVARARRYRLIDADPIAGVPMLVENNTREVVLADDEFERLLDACPDHLRGPVLLAWYSGMRRGEVLGLRWSEVYLKEGIIRLPGLRTKNGHGRVIPLHPRVQKEIERLQSGRFQSPFVFQFQGKRILDVKRAFDTARRKANLPDFRFHDLRHCAINNLRLAGNDHYTIMQVSGHRTDSAFRRYNLVTEEEMRSLRFRDTQIERKRVGDD